MVPSPCKGAKKNHRNKYPQYYREYMRKKYLWAVKALRATMKACLGMSTGSMSCQIMVTSSGSLVTVRFIGSEDADALASKGPSSPFLSLKLVI
jgi:hypothetical protein